MKLVAKFGLLVSIGVLLSLLVFTKTRFRQEPIDQNDPYRLLRAARQTGCLTGRSKRGQIYRRYHRRHIELNYVD